MEAILYYDSLFYWEYGTNMKYILQQLKTEGYKEAKIYKLVQERKTNGKRHWE